MLFITGHNGKQPRHHITQPADSHVLLIALTQGQEAMIDSEDLDKVKAYTWRAQWSPSTRSYYAVTTSTREGKEITLMMHSLILPLVDHRLPDHKSRNTLDNRKVNLRPATRSENGINNNGRVNNTSGHRGVSWNKQWKRWVAYITFRGKRLFLGGFIKKEDAIEARCKKEIELFGEFSPLFHS